LSEEGTTGGDVMHDRDTDDFRTWQIDAEPKALPAAAQERATKALELLIDGELKLLAIYDQRQSNADSRTTALATSAIGLPTVVLALAKGFSTNKPSALPKVPVRRDRPARPRDRRRSGLERLAASAT